MTTPKPVPDAQMQQLDSPTAVYPVGKLKDIVSKIEAASQTPPPVKTAEPASKGSAPRGVQPLYVAAALFGGILLALLVATVASVIVLSL